ncbi:MAG TPA: nucleotidyltransferase domain-containing protein [Candidatus Thermoplasmatota archaeon]|nr:nucleotidyltransferase domain-containing protein [Candidatus Thermoplasmatota archaeon]
MGTTVWIDDGTREALRTLQRTLGTGSVNATIRRLLDQPATDAHSLFARHRAAIRAILRRHRLRNLVAFGSRARGDAQAASDLDLAVEVATGASPLAVLAAEADIEKELGISVNLVELPNAKLKDVLRREGVPFER